MNDSKEVMCAQIIAKLAEARTTLKRLMLPEDYKVEVESAKTIVRMVREKKGFGTDVESLHYILRDIEVESLFTVPLLMAGTLELMEKEAPDT